MSATRISAVAQAVSQLWGLMQFFDGQTPGQMYNITDADLLVIAVPYPPNEVQPVNLPLRLALSRLVAGIITGNLISDQWHIVTSLVKSEELEAVFPITMEIQPWQLEGIDIPFREAICGVQGLK